MVRHSMLRHPARIARGIAVERMLTIQLPAVILPARTMAESRIHGRTPLLGCWARRVQRQPDGVHPAIVVVASVGSWFVP